VLSIVPDDICGKDDFAPDDSLSGYLAGKPENAVTNSGFSHEIYLDVLAISYQINDLS